MSIGCVAIAGRPQDVVSSSGALWGHQTAETARGREWCIRYRITRLRNSVLSIANAPTGESSVLLCSPVRSVSTSGTVEIEARLSEENKARSAFLFHAIGPRNLTAQGYSGFATETN